MIFLRILLLVWLSFTPYCHANPVTLEHTTASLISDVDQISPGKPFWLVLKLNLKPQWHTYWLNPGTTGKAMTMDWTLPSGFTASPIYWLPPERRQENSQVSFIYEKEAYYLVQITPPDDLAPSSTLICHANWLTCGQMCAPEACDISIILPTSPLNTSPSYSEHHFFIQQLQGKLPKKLSRPGHYSLQNKHIDFTISLKDEHLHGIQSALLFPYEEGVIDYAPPQKTDWKEGILTLTAATFKASLEASCSALLQVIDKEDNVHFYQLDFMPHLSSVTKAEDHSIEMILFFALLGGFILNAMPCVFPILSIKALTIAKKKKSELKKVYLQGLMYTAGVLTSFLVLAFLLIALKKGGHSIGWGFQMQSSYFVTFIIYLTFLIGLSLSGVFYLPIFFGNANAAVEESRKRDSFLLGVLAVLVATPCTAPFMGIAIGYALTQSAFTIVIVFSALALGFALPYLILCLFPPLLTFLPKPGAWMETFKQALAFPMYGTVLWLLWVVVQQGGSRALITIGAGLIIMAFCVWLWQKLPLRSNKLKVAIFLIFSGSSVAPLYYLTPSPFHQIIPVEPFSKMLLEKYQQEKIPVLVNVTASWCITCKYNEIAIKSKVMQKYFAEKGIHYLEADWTNQSDEITNYLEDFNRSGVPLYIFYFPDKEPLVLPQLLTAEGLKSILEENFPESKKL